MKGGSVTCSGKIVSNIYQVFHKNIKVIENDRKQVILLICPLGYREMIPDGILVQ